MLSQGAESNQIIGAVGYGKERPGAPEDSFIPQVQMLIVKCWNEEPNECLTLVGRLICVLSLAPVK